MRLELLPRSRWRTRSAIAASLVGLLSITSWLPSALAEKTAADYFVHSLPGAPDGPLLKMHAGHLEITPEHHGNLFFWHFQNRHLADKPRTVIWLNGGPGCSSEDGALMEIGRYRVREGGKLEYNEGAWDEFANVLFVDNPVGTGFSYADTDSYLHELQEMADQFVQFLEKWFTIFPQYQHDEIYLAGESYAGQHIPYIARAMLERNKGMDSSAVWNLNGLLIGNGWISGPDQYPAYLQFAYKHGILKEGSQEAVAVEKQQAICNRDLSNGGMNHIDTHSCEEILRMIYDSTTVKKDGKDMCVNIYDVRLLDESPSCGMNWPPDLATVTPYLRREDVKQALHINPDKRTGWQECSGAVSMSFTARNSEPSIKLLPGLLEQIPILLFSGDQDLICNHIGTENLINSLEWNGGKGMEMSPGVWAPRRQWTFEEEPAGVYQEARNLTYLLFYNSSHMVPFDFPRRTRDMLDRFMGIDIASIGGAPTDSRIDGEKGPVTSVGGHPNSTAAEEDQAKKLKEAEWKAYQKSGEAALIVVAIAAAVWGFFVWRDRRRRKGYQGVWGGEPSENGHAGRGMLGGMGLEGLRHKRHGQAGGERDVEAAETIFEDNEMDDLGEGGSEEERRGLTRKDEEMRKERYSLGEASSSDEEEKARI